MLSKNLNKFRRKPGVTTVALLSLLLGAQIAAYAGYAYDFGFNRGQQAMGVYGTSSAGFVSFYVSSLCYDHFTSQVDINSCINGGQVAFNIAQN